MPLTIGLRGAVRIGAAACTTGVTASTSAASTSGVSFSIVVSSWFSSAAASVVSGVSPSSSLAATSKMLASTKAGRVTCATPDNVALLTFITPLSMVYSSALASIEKLGRKPSAASISASVPAVVGAILKAMLIPAGVISSLPAIPRPKTFVATCSRLRIMFSALKSAKDPNSNATAPAEVLPTLPNGTTMPRITRVSVSAASILPSKLIFISFTSSRG